MKKREFLKTSGLLALGAIVSPLLVGCQDKKALTANNKDPKNSETPPPPVPNTVFELPKLDYAPDALVPVIDKMTVEIHYGKHHAGYANNLNNALKTNAAFAGRSLEEIVQAISKNEVDTVVRNNAGGLWNHNLYWQIVAPPTNNPAPKPSGKLLEAINGTFGNVETMLNKLRDAALGQFGSGWAWLNVGADKKLFISATPNQDNPLMRNVVAQAGTPILGVDVWEHAYYLNYQNRRKDYVEAFLGILRWDRIAERFAAASL